MLAISNAMGIIPLLFVAKALRYRHAREAGSTDDENGLDTKRLN